jgi:integrase
MARFKREKGRKTFEREEIARLIAYSYGTDLEAFIMLGINCGLGNTDIALMRYENVQGEWLDYPRNKTEAPRRGKLWLETVEALNDIAYMKPGKRLFHRPSGGPYIRVNQKTGESNDYINPLFSRAMRECDINGGNLSFYSLRHTFATIASEARDQPAVNYAMGHVDGSMAAVYRERIDDSRLSDISDYVRDWLFGCLR